MKKTLPLQRLPMRHFRILKYAFHGPTSVWYCFARTRTIWAICVKSCTDQVAISSLAFTCPRLHPHSHQYQYPYQLYPACMSSNPIRPPSRRSQIRLTTVPRPGSERASIRPPIAWISSLATAIPSPLPSAPLSVFNPR